MFYLVFSLAMAACPNYFGKQNAGGSWSFSTTQQAGMLEAESDPQTCLPEAGTHTLSNGKFVINNAALAAKKAAEAIENSEEKFITKKQLKKLIRELAKVGVVIDESWL